jgi:hypothetical protein
MLVYGEWRYYKGAPANVAYGGVVVGVVAGVSLLGAVLLDALRLLDELPQSLAACGCYV